MTTMTGSAVETAPIDATTSSKRQSRAADMLVLKIGLGTIAAVAIAMTGLGIALGSPALLASATAATAAGVWAGLYTATNLAD